MSCLFDVDDTIRVIYCQEKEARWVEFFFPIHVDLNNKNYYQISIDTFGFKSVRLMESISRMNMITSNRSTCAYVQETYENH